MNRTLISFLDGFNQFLAIIITLAGAIVVWVAVGDAIANPFIRLCVAAFGGIIGFLVAALICGLLALLIEIESHLRALREQPKA
jgi:hypothetical protein